MSQPIIEKDGEFKGWMCWPSDAFEHALVGPFYFKTIGGENVARFRAEARHTNSGGTMHGGCLMTFADFTLFAIANDYIDFYGVTVAFTSEFLAAARPGQMMEGRGEVLKAGGSLIFIRGVITADGDPVLNFSGTVKKIKKK